VTYYFPSRLDFTPLYRAVRELRTNITEGRAAASWCGKEVLTGETLSKELAGPGGSRASNPGDLDDQTPRPTS